EKRDLRSTRFIPRRCDVRMPQNKVTLIQYGRTNENTAFPPSSPQPAPRRASQIPANGLHNVYVHF
ncbi:MAG: hypothetical protein ACLFOY_05375, partial [Desulfatibacillaceae bacterium]